MYIWNEMDGIQYIKDADNKKRYAVVDLKRWQQLFDFFLEEVEDTIAYDEALIEESKIEKGLKKLKEKINPPSLSLYEPENEGLINGNGHLHLEIDDNPLI